MDRHGTTAGRSHRFPVGLLPLLVGTHQEEELELQKTEGHVSCLGKMPGGRLSCQPYQKRKCQEGQGEGYIADFMTIANLYSWIPANMGWFEEKTSLFDDEMGSRFNSVGDSRNSMNNVVCDGTVGGKVLRR